MLGSYLCTRCLQHPVLEVVSVHQVQYAPWLHGDISIKFPFVTLYSNLGLILYRAACRTWGQRGQNEIFKIKEGGYGMRVLKRLGGSQN